MIYFICALYSEARPFIRHYDLKRDTSVKAFSLYTSKEKDVITVVSGTGRIAAAFAAAYTFAAFPPGKKDHLINYGCAGLITKGKSFSAGSSEKDLCSAGPDRAGTECKQGSIFIINKIFEKATGRTYYPDMLVKTGFSELPVLTVDKVIKDADSLQEFAKAEESLCNNDHGAFLVDMEASAVYQSGIHFFSPDRMHFIKAVSDIVGEELMKSDQFEAMLQEKSIAVIGIAERLSAEKDLLTIDIADEEKAQLISDLKCSKAMEEQVMLLLRYCCTEDIDIGGIVGELHDSGLLPVKNKKEGVRCLEEIRKRILSPSVFTYLS